MIGLIFIVFIISLIIYCLYRVHSNIVFNLSEPFCPSCNKIFDPEHTYYHYCPDCHVKIIWRRKKKIRLLKELKEYRKRRRRD